MSIILFLSLVKISFKIKLQKYKFLFSFLIKAVEIRTGYLRPDFNFVIN